VTCNERIYLGELPVGLSTLLSCGYHSLCGHPIGGPALSLHVGAPLPAPRGPLAEGPECHPCEPPKGSACSRHVGPCHFWPQIMAWFRVLSTCMCWAQGCCCKRWRGEQVGAQHDIVLLPDSCRHTACGRLLSAHIIIVKCQVPPRHVAHAGSCNEVISGRGVTCCLASVCSICWQSIAHSIFLAWVSAL
jgi:hypothetical protein